MKYALALIVLLVIAGCASTPAPVSEQSAGEVCSAPSGERMSFKDAKRLAEESVCGEDATITSRSECNPNTGTWWIDIEPHAAKDGCNPACVVLIDEQSAEINWRCTGLLLPE